MLLPHSLLTPAAILIVVAGMLLVARRVDVRLVLFLTGLLLAALVGRPLAALDRFTETMVKADYVVPICCSMGFAYVLKFTGCDTHLVRLLVAPLRRLGKLAVPAGVLVPFVVNTAVTSQSSTAATVGPVLIPLLLAAGLSPARAGTALLIGSSIGGELLNAGAPEVAAIARQSGVSVIQVIERMLLPCLAVGTAAALVFWWGTWRPEPKLEEAGAPDSADAPPSPGPVGEGKGEPIRLLKAIIPLVPVVLLVLDANLHRLQPTFLAWHIHLPSHLFPRPVDPTTWKEWMAIGYAMLIGTGLAMLTAVGQLSGSAAAFFQGQGFAYTYIISLIVAAMTFFEGLKQAGLMDLAIHALAGRQAVIVPAAVVVPGGLALLTGSGIAPSITFIEAFVPHAATWGLDPAGLGMVAAQAAAIGRTLSPAAAVVMVSSTLAGVTPLALLRRAAPPLIAAWVVTLLLGFWLAR
jgi:DcuC family C4-dicarboxylate transporter